MINWHMNFLKLNIMFFSEIIFLTRQSYYRVQLEKRNPQIGATNTISSNSQTRLLTP
jgi:hypothetical protein